MIKKLLVANRGEIAVRIIQAAKALNISTVAVCSEADTETLAVQIADEFCVIGAAHSTKSYLNIDAILLAAKQTGADAIHPGYGFLAENAEFAEAVAAQGLIFVGPNAQTIRQMGDKAEARKTAQLANVPVVPGSDGELSNLNDALIAAEKVGFPLLIKASAGGGGRGIRLVKSPQEFEAEFIAAQNEAQSAFNHNGVYLERFIAHARHIEVQILGDGVNVIHLFDRECSLQRRRQKIFEEAPSPALNDQQRTSLCESAVRLAQSINYKGAGTLEYLFDAQTGEFFFIEMNTRIQVEHPISEMITGLDLIQMMLKIASGESLGIKQTEIKINGVALEMRINAEDPKRNFLPNLGTVETLSWPKGDGIRIDSHLYQGYKIPPYYDSLLAKIIIHAPTREAALNKAKKALAETQIVGMTTTIELHQWLLDYPHMRLAQFDTNSLEVWLTDYVQYALEGVQK